MLAVPYFLIKLNEYPRKDNVGNGGIESRYNNFDRGY